MQICILPDHTASSDIDRLWISPQLLCDSGVMYIGVGVPGDIGKPLDTMSPGTQNPI